MRQLADPGVLAANPAISPARRIDACVLLIQAGKFDDVEAPLSELASIAETAAEAKRLRGLCRQIRRWAALEQFKPHKIVRGVGLQSSPGAHLMLSRRPGADKVVFVFTGLRQNFWLTLYVLHRSLPKEDCHIVYLRETRRQFYLGGIEGVGGDYKASVSALRDVVTALDARQSYCIGVSAGGYAALRYGLDLGSSSVLCFGPAFVDRDSLWQQFEERANLQSVVRYPRRYVGKAVSTFKKERHLLMGKIWRTICGKGLARQVVRTTEDIRVLYQKATPRPNVILVYGDAHKADSERCRHLDGLQGVSLHPLPECEEHNVLPLTIASGQFKSLIGAMLAGGAG